MGKYAEEDHIEDALRSFPITLPKLASPHERNAALLAGDWLTQIKPGGRRSLARPWSAMTSG